MTINHKNGLCLTAIFALSTALALPAKAEDWQHQAGITAFAFGMEGNGGVKARATDKSEFGDIELAANALGICDDAVGMAMAFARSHKRAGKLLIDHQLIQLKLNEMYMLTEALRSFVLRTAWERDRKLPDLGNNVLVMNYSQEVVQRVTRDNMDVHGVEGCMMNARVDKLVRDAMVWTHLAGDTVQRVKVVKRLPLTTGG